MAKRYDLHVEITGDAPEHYELRDLAQSLLNQHARTVKRGFYVESVTSGEDLYAKGYEAGHDAGYIAAEEDLGAKDDE